MRVNEADEVRVATLIEVLVKGQPPLRVQNWQKGIYFYDDQPYEYSSFEASGISRQLEVTGSQMTATIENSTGHDAIRQIRDRVQMADGWRSAIVRITNIWPDDPDAEPYLYRTQVSSSEIGQAINLSLRHPIDAINANVAALSFTNQDIPGLPSSGSGGLGG
jgi:hypothetical protein